MPYCMSREAATCGFSKPLMTVRDHWRPLRPLWHGPSSVEPGWLSQYSARSGYWRQTVFDAGNPFWLCYALPNPDRGRPAVAVKQVRVSDLSGQQAGEEQFAKLQPRERSGQRALLSVDRFNKLASSG